MIFQFVEHTSGKSFILSLFFFFFNKNVNIKTFSTKLNLFIF